MGIPAFAGNLQLQYESNNKSTLTNNASYLLADDYKRYNSNGGSIYGVIIYQLENLDKNSIDYNYIFKVKQNYDSNFMHIEKWQYINVPDSEYSSLYDNTKNIILFNNLIFHNK